MLWNIIYVYMYVWWLAFFLVCILFHWISKFVVRNRSSHTKVTLSISNMSSLLLKISIWIIWWRTRFECSFKCMYLLKNSYNLGYFSESSPWWCNLEYYLFRLKSFSALLLWLWNELKKCRFIYSVKIVRKLF